MSYVNIEILKNKRLLWLCYCALYFLWLIQMLIDCILFIMKILSQCPNCNVFMLKHITVNSSYQNTTLFIWNVVMSPFWSYRCAVQDESVWSISRYIVSVKCTMNQSVQYPATLCQCSAWRINLLVIQLHCVSCVSICLWKNVICHHLVKLWSRSFVWIYYNYLLIEYTLITNTCFMKMKQHEGWVTQI